MNYSKLLQTILDIAEEMLVSGAEVIRVNDSIRRIASAYGCTPDRTNAFIITTNIQVTIETPEKEIITQIRQIVRTENNYDKLDQLNDLSRYICANTPSIDEIETRLGMIMKRNRHPRWVEGIGAFMVAGGFGSFFGGSILDSVISGILGVAILFIIRRLYTFDENQMARVFITSIIGGAISIGLVYIALWLGYTAHIDKIIIGGIMLLIPGIALTNAVRDMLIGDIATGLLRLSNSLLLAIAIACGFALPLLTLGDAFALRQSDANFIGNSMTIQIIAGFVGSLGFAIYYNIKGKKMIYAGLGGGVTWAVYLFLINFWTDRFIATLISAIFVGVFAEVMARINRTPATIFLTAAAVPLIPGGALYYTMAGVLLENKAQVHDNGTACISVALAISLGFIIVAVLNKYYGIAKMRKRQKLCGKK